MKGNHTEFFKSQASAFNSVSPTQKDIYSGRKINSQLNSQVIDSRNSDNVKRFPQVIECQETKKNQQKLHWRSHQFNTSEDDIIMLGHQQSLQQLHINQYTDIKQSLSPKTSHNQKKGSSLQQQQEKLKKIVNLQNTQASQKLLNAQTNTSLTNKQNNISMNNQNGVQINQMSKSSSSSILPPTKSNLLTQPTKLNRSSHIKANNMLHLSNSIDYDCSSSYINPFNYISIKGGPQSTTSQKKGQNQSTNNISNQQITKIRNSSQSNQRKTPQNINNSMNQPISSQILTSTSQNSNNSKVPNFFASPKVKKRQSATAAAVSNGSQVVSMQSSANKTNISKRALQLQSQKNNTDTQQKVNSQILGENNDEKVQNINTPSAQKLHSQLNQNLTIIQNNESINNQSSHLQANSPNSTYHQYQVLSQKSKKSIQNSSSNGATQGIAKKKKKKTESSKNNFTIQSPQSTSYSALNINSSVKNNKQTNKNLNNNSISNQSKLHNASQLTLDEDQCKKDQHVTHLLQSYQERNEQNENEIDFGLQKGNKDQNQQQGNGRGYENTAPISQTTRVSNTQENQKTLGNNQIESRQEEEGNYDSSKQISRQSEKIYNEQENEENKIKRDSKKKKKSRRKSPSNREQNYKSKSPSQSRSQKRKQRSSQKRKYLKTSQSPSRSQNKSYSTHLQVSTDNFHQISKSLKQNQKLNSIKSSDNLENHSQNQNHFSSEEVSKTQQNSLDKTKSQQYSIESSVRAKNQSEKLYNAQELINQNLQKQKLQKMIQLQKQKQEQEERLRKSQYLQEINEKYRQLNSQKSPKRDQNNQQFSSQQNSATAQQINHINAFSPIQVDHKLPWGANQQKLNVFQNQQKMHKNQKSENEEPISSNTLQIIQMQKKEYQEKQRRERLGLGFLNDKNDSFVEQIVQKSKEKAKQINSQNSQFEQEMKTKKKHLLDAQRLQEIHKYMVYKKSIYEQNNMMKNQEKISKITKIKENKYILESNIKNILKRLKHSSSKSIKSKAAYPSLKLNPHYLSQLTETNGTQGPINYHFTSSDSFCQNNLTSQNVCNLESIPIDSIDNTEENNYSYLQEEYKKMMNESLQKTFFFNKYSQLDNHPSNSTNNANDGIKTKNYTKSNQKMKSQIQSNKKDKKSGLQDTIKENYSDNDFNDLRGRDRAQVMKQKFNDLSNRFKKLLDNQSPTTNHEQTELQRQSLSPQIQQDENLIKNQPKKDGYKNGSQSIQNKKAFKINDDNQVNTNGVNTTSTTTQNPNQLIQKTSENHTTIPAFSANEHLQMKQDNDVEEIYQDDFIENGEYTDQDYYFIAVQYLNQSATQIQKLWRGYKARKIFHQLVLNSNWLQKQEKIELNDFYNNNKDVDYGDNQDKVINISTIKSSIVSVNDQNDDQYKNSFPDVLAHVVQGNKQIPSIVKEEDSSQSRSPNTNCDINYNNYNNNNPNNNSIQDQELQQGSSKNSYHQASQQQYNQNTLDYKQNKQQNYDNIQSQQDLQGFKELVIQKFAQFSSQLQNAQNVNMDKEQSMKFLSQLQQITEEYKNELMSSFQNKLFGNQFADQSLSQSGNKIYQNEKKENADHQMQVSVQNQFNNPQNEEVKMNSHEEIDNILIKNNEDQYEDKSLDGNEGNQESTNRQSNYHQNKADYTENELLIRLLQDHAMKQELNQLYLLLIQEASKDKEKKYYPSSQASGVSNQNSYRNSHRVKTNPDETDKDQRLQSSVDSIGQESASSSLFDRDSFKLFTEKKLKELQKNEFIEEIIRLREQIINMRHKTEVEYMNKMLKENAVSPRTYTTNKLELDNWAKKEQDELKETKNDFEKSLKRAIDSISKTKLDYELTKKYKENLHHNEIQGNNNSPFLIQKQFLVDNNQNDNQSDYSIGQNMKNLLPVSLQINETNTEENPLNSINSGFDNENFHKFKEELKANALKELNNSSYYSSSDAQINKSPLESLSNRKYQNNKKTSQENDDADDLVKVEERSPSQQGAFSDRNRSFDGKKMIFQEVEGGNQDDKLEKIVSSSSISNQNNNNNNNSEDQVILITTTSKQNLQSSCESFNSQYDQKNPKMKDQLWDSSNHLNHNHESQEYQQKNRERFTNEKMIIKKEEHHAQHPHQLGYVKKSPRFEQFILYIRYFLSFIFIKVLQASLILKITSKIYLLSLIIQRQINKYIKLFDKIIKFLKYQIQKQNLFIEDEPLYQKKIQPIFPSNQIQNTNMLNNNNNNNNNNSSISNNSNNIQTDNQLNNQQQISSNQPDKKDENTNFNAQIVVNEVFNSINEGIFFNQNIFFLLIALYQLKEIKEKWRMNAQVEERLNEQLNRQGCIDKSDRYGIPSNLYVIEQYIMSLFQYVKSIFTQ
ncbi:IQ calmodulin-binding motif protein (macronuclear) [Tetrahymena thermophila SB210]|uniref:IQ calmodulin-binding motif protein n=1 Tax=Tetrahymena thermophila (strain SB210) TaxID=312017 RepID=W7X8E5_TETTS|nr:IQ calmodulin-binding motif protein [Tetrahymena thermophila SB210]EWS73617.1 IQ calmodulin-binding motif protein [Tetrahymena thermophila SB210]|eukprot:XP_012653847.1 IQ calmodulin-binding motif protein [Tetrahymena thermophila SB210]